MRGCPIVGFVDYMNPFVADSIVWPLALVLVALMVLRRFSALIDPLLHEVVGGLSGHAKRYAFAYAMAMVYAAAASLQALADEATRLGWVYVAASAKVIQPGAVALIAYVSKSPTVQAKEDQKP